MQGVRSKKVKVQFKFFSLFLLIRKNGKGNFVLDFTEDSPITIQGHPINNQMQLHMFYK